MWFAGTLQEPFLREKTKKDLAATIGKDEVGGSNPPSSSRKHLKSEDFRCFFVTNFRFSMWVKMWVSGLTHTVTHTRKGNNGHKRAGQEAQGFLPGFFLSALHDLLYEVPHGLGGFVLFLPGGVGVGSQGKSGVEVAQHGGHGFHIHTVL